MKYAAIKPRQVALALLVAAPLTLSAETIVSTSPLSAERTAATTISSSPFFGEYEIKAGFIYRFLSFVTWPDNQAGRSTITIGILGKNPFGNAFDSIAGRAAKGQTIKLEYFSDLKRLKQIKNCQVLFIAKSEANELEHILNSLENSSTLTISDCDQFIDQNGMIGFVKKPNNRIGIELNVGAANRAGLTFRSMLKRIAVRIIDDPITAKGIRHASLTLYY